MKIAFVGKGGAGKTTTSTLFSQLISKNQTCLAIDADINMHMAELLGAGRPSKDKLLSEKQPSDTIRTYLRGSNQRITSNAAFKKSTPPGKGSNIISVAQKDDWFMRTFTHSVSDTLSLATVGSYSEEGIASSCYHNNLAILENVLSHSNDSGAIVVDMVAGTDAFASTLFAQFDALVFVVEPTKRGLAVLDDYLRLAEAGGVKDRVLVIANKVDDEDDEAFVQERCAGGYIGALHRSKHLASVDKGREALDVDKMSSSAIQTLNDLADRVQQMAIPSQQRLSALWDIHKVYVGQGYVRDRFGDLTGQIDVDFSYE